MDPGSEVVCRAKDTSSATCSSDQTPTGNIQCKQPSATAYETSNKTSSTEPFVDSSKKSRRQRGSSLSNNPSSSPGKDDRQATEPPSGQPLKCSELQSIRNENLSQQEATLACQSDVALQYSSLQAPVAPGPQGERRKLDVSFGPVSPAAYKPPWRWFPKSSEAGPSVETMQSSGAGPSKEVSEKEKLLQRSHIELLEDWIRRSPAPELAEPSADSLCVSGALEQAKGETSGSSGTQDAERFDDLPRVLLLAVLGHLSNPRDVAAFATSCRAAREAACDQGIWRSFFAKRWGHAALAVALQQSGRSLQCEYSSRERLLQELRHSSFLAQRSQEIDEGPALCRCLLGVLDLLMVEQLEVCQAQAAVIAKEVDLFLGLLRIFRCPPTPSDDPAYTEAFCVALQVFGTMVRRCPKLTAARLLRREDGSTSLTQGPCPPQCRFTHESMFAHFVQNLKKPAIYSLPLRLPDARNVQTHVWFEMCEAIVPHMYLLPVQVWELTTPIADWNGMEWPRFSEEPFRRWLLPEWPVGFAGLWYGHYMYRNQGQLGAPDPAMHVTLYCCEQMSLPDGQWGYSFSGSGDDGYGCFSMEGTIQQNHPPLFESSRIVFGGVEFVKRYSEPIEDVELHFVGKLNVLGMTGIWGSSHPKQVKGTWALAPVSSFPNNARALLS